MPENPTKREPGWPWRREAPARRDQRVVQAVMTRAGTVMREGPPCGSAGSRSRELPPEPVRVVSAVPAAAGNVLHVLFIEREAARADEPEGLHAAAMAAGRSRPRAAAAAGVTRGLGCPTRRDPVEVIISVRVRTRARAPARRSGR